jgi:hypothetical protein
MKQSGRNRWQLVANRTRSASIRLVSPSQVGSSVMVRTTAQVRVVALERGQLVDESGRFPVAVRVDQRHPVGKLFLGDVAEHAAEDGDPDAARDEHVGTRRSDCGGTRPRRAGGGGRPDGAPDHAPFRGPRPGRRGRATRWMCGRRARSPPTRSSALVARPEGRSGHDSEHLLLVVDGGSRRARRRRRSPSARGSASRPRTCRRCRSRSRARSSRR